MDNRFQVQLFSRHHRKAVGEIEAHLPAEDGAGAGARTVGFIVTVFQHMAHQIEVLLHGRKWLTS